MLNTSFPPWPSFSDEEANAVHRVLKSNKVNYWTGEETRFFEKEFAEFTHTKHAIALSNGTLALDLALRGLSVGPGDEVVVTPRTFIASVSCVVTAGARPVFADVDLNSQCLSAETIEKVLTPRTKVVIVVHLAGFPADMDAIMALSLKHGFKVVEDCAQAHGAMYKGQPVGGLGHVAAWSFCQDKIMTTGGEGGMVTTDDEALWSAMWSYKDHGKSWSSVYEKQHPPGFRWLHDTFGTNWRMTELQGVLGRLQLNMMTDWQRKRLENAERIWQHCRQYEWLRVPVVPADCRHAAYKAYVFVEPSKLPSGWSRDQIIAAISEQDVPVFSGSCSEVYREKAFEGTDFAPVERLPNARELGKTSIMFLVHPTLEITHIDRTLAAIDHVASQIETSRSRQQAAESAAASSPLPWA